MTAAGKPPEPTESERRLAESTTLHTIGYGSRSMAEFVDLLDAHGIDYLVDVRSRPFSRYRPEFSKEPLAAELEAIGFTYLWMGEQLGGIPDDPAYYTEEGDPDRAKIAASSAFEAGIARLERAFHKKARLCLMCAELKPEACHRAKIIGEELARRGIPLAHIDERGRLIGQAEALDRITRGQNDLFDDLLAGASASTRQETPVPPNRIDEEAVDPESDGGAV
jgi:ATP-dependent DNA helicase RecQ